jgi:hypothetical protein
MTQAADDLGVLRQLAEEIKEFGYPGLPGGLRQFLRTKRAIIVGAELERLARMTIDQRAEVARLTEQVHHLRNEMQLVTDALLAKDELK